MRRQIIVGNLRNSARICGDIILPPFWRQEPLQRIGQDKRGDSFPFPCSSWPNQIIFPPFSVAVLIYSISVTVDKIGQAIAIGEYVFNSVVFHQLLDYVWVGGYPRWQEGTRPDYVVAIQKIALRSHDPPKIHHRLLANLVRTVVC